MKHGEYERRKFAIEEQLHADLELVRAGYLAKLRALEFLWLASPGEKRPDASREKLASAETQNPLETPASSGPPGSVETPEPVESPGAVPVPEAAPASPAPASRATRRGDVLAEILDTFPRLPEVFDKTDVVRLLGYEPSRPSLHRAWRHLLNDQKIVTERYSDGRRPARFRKMMPA